MSRGVWIVMVVAPGGLCGELLPAQVPLPAKACDTVVLADTLLPGVANAWANAIALTSWARARGAPQFDDYLARDTFPSPPAGVDLRSAPGARRYRTRLTEGAKEGPNFAGHYTVVEWGCGSPCWQFAIIDARTGQILLYDPKAFYIRPPLFRRDSRLLIEDPTG
jgi:hypothetical protein